MAERAVVLDWSAAVDTGTAVVGGKGWNLGRLSRYGFDVPVGGVLPAGVYASLLAQPEFRTQVAPLAGVSAEQATDADVQSRLERLRSSLLDASLPPETRSAVDAFLQQHGLTTQRVAVRSSAVAEDGAGAAFAGIHDSVLGVVGLDAVVQAVLICYASLWTPQALAYRRRFDIPDDETPCAVVICEMVGDPETGPVAAGVAFSCDPVSGERGVITINLAAGLGDSVVSGEVNPQQYAVRREGQDVALERTDRTGEPAVLDAGRVEQLGRLVARVHWALGDGDHPYDVEWAWDGSRFWMLQARPVTRVPRWTFSGVPTGAVTWSNANVRDSFPRPLTTMTWSFVDASAQAIVYAATDVVGYPLPPGMEVMRRFAGRPYFDLDALQWCLWDAFGISPAEVNRTMGGFQSEITVPPGNPMRGRGGLARVSRRFKLLNHFMRFEGWTPARINAMIHEARQARARDLSALDQESLRQHLVRVFDLGLDYQPVLQVAASYYGGWIKGIQDLLALTTGDRGTPLVGRLLAASGDVASAEQGHRIQELGRLATDDPEAEAALSADDQFAWRALPDTSPFRAGMERYLEDFGHRAVFEMEFASPRWSEAPGYLLEQIRFHLDEAESSNQRDHAAEVRRHAEEGLAEVPFYVRPMIRWLLNRARIGAGLRENAKSGTAAAVAMVRQVCLEVGHRLQADGHLATPDDVFHLAMVDIDAYLAGSWDGAGARALAEDRARRIAAEQEMRLPGVIVGDEAEAPASTPVPEAAADATWSGLAAAPGVAAGRARVIETPHDGGRLKRGDVLVAPSTDPGWTPLFLRASAVVMETGGYLSHGAVVAREFGLPAVVNVEDAMRLIKDDDHLRVDGDAGVVSRVPA